MIQIDTEFQKHIPAMRPEERRGLEESLKLEGCRDSLITWNGILIDGHNRYEICERLNIPYETSEMLFDSRADVIEWIENNQLSRRNLTDAQTRYFRGQQYNRVKKSHGGDREPSAQVEHLPKTAEIVASEHGVSRETIKRDAELAKRIDNDDSLRELVMSGATTQEVKKTAHVSNNSGNNEWYTPEYYIETARKLMGSIDTDPASNPVANKTVKADVYYTAETNGLDKDWHGNIWLNPPYAQPLIQQFADKLVEQVKAGNVKQACILVNNATETKWFRTIAGVSSQIWFIANRIKFIDMDGNASGAPLQGQAMLYIGSNTIEGVDGIVCEVK